MVGVACLAVAFEGYENTQATVAPLVRLRLTLFLGAAAWAVAGPLAVTLGQQLAGRSKCPPLKKKAWGLTEL
jgi:hypothetical protein